MATLLTKKSDTASSVPLAADLTNAAGGAELAVNTADKRLYSKTSGGAVVELGTNPSSMTLPNGTANGIPYLNGSKVLTSGSALTFDGTNLGVGVASPFRPLDVLQRTNDTTPAVLLRGYTTGADGARTVLVSAVSSDANNWANLTFSAQSHIWQYQGSERMRLDSSGNLGLGVTPSAWLSSQKALEVSGWSVNAASVTSSMATNAYVNSGSSWIYKATGYATRYDNVSGQHQWYTAPSGTAGTAASFTQAMTLDAGGRLNVGATSFGAALRAGFRGDSSSTATVEIQNESSTGTMLTFRTNGESQVGSVSFSAVAVIYNTTSDHRLKTVLGSITDSGARIDALEPIEYEWKSDGSRTRGFLAHKFQEVYTGSVTGTKDAVDKDGKPVYQAMQAGSSEVIADLVAEIQSLRKRLAAAGI